MQSGYPYLMFKDNANKVQIRRYGEIKISNLCNWDFPASGNSEIQCVDDVIKRDISCNLGSMNIANVMDSGKVKETVHEGIAALTLVSDDTAIANAPGVKKANDELHSVGLGAMNLHGYLAKNKISYESAEARDFANISYDAEPTNWKIYGNCKERGDLKDFERSDYATGKYFERYTAEDIKPEFEKVAELFEHIHVPTKEDWAELQQKVETNGLYHAYRLAIAPTQSISYVQNATSSVMPIVDTIERRTYGNSETFYPMPFLSKETMWYYRVPSTQIGWKVDMIAKPAAHRPGHQQILYVNSKFLREN